MHGEVPECQANCMEGAWCVCFGNRRCRGACKGRRGRADVVMPKSGMSKGQNITGVQRYTEMELGFETSPVVDMVL